jgi:hypothetical protein
MDWIDLAQDRDKWRALKAPQEELSFLEAKLSSKIPMGNSDS